MAQKRYFTRETFRFLKELKENNDRDWFAENKHRYESHVKAPSLHLIEDFGARLPELSGHFRATPRSLFRIYRDVRFSKDKSPYKTAAGIHFRHVRAKDAYAPGYYLHIEPGEVFVACGIWHPQGPALRAIRERIVEDSDAWVDVNRSRTFRQAFELEGDSLKRAPRDFGAEHPLIDDLKRKDFIGVRRVPQSFVTSDDLPDDLLKAWADATPFMRFLCDALGVPF